MELRLMWLMRGDERGANAARQPGMRAVVAQRQRIAGYGLPGVEWMRRAGAGLAALPPRPIYPPTGAGIP